MQTYVNAINTSSLQLLSGFPSWNIVMLHLLTPTDHEQVRYRPVMQSLIFTTHRRYSKDNYTAHQRLNYVAWIERLKFQTFYTFKRLEHFLSVKERCTCQKINKQQRKKEICLIKWGEKHCQVLNECLKK